MLVQHVVGGSLKLFNSWGRPSKWGRDKGNTISLFQDPYVSVNQAKNNSHTGSVVSVGVWGLVFLLLL